MYKSAKKKANFATGDLAQASSFSLERQCSRGIFKNRCLSRLSKNASDKLSYFYVLSRSPLARHMKSPNPRKLG